MAPCGIAFLIWTSTHKKLKSNKLPQAKKTTTRKRLVFFFASLHQVVVTSARDSVQGSQPDLLSFSVYLSFLFCLFLFSLDWQLNRPISGLLYPTANGGKGFVCVSLSWWPTKREGRWLGSLCVGAICCCQRMVVGGGGLRNPTGIYFFFLFYLNNSSH